MDRFSVFTFCILCVWLERNLVRGRLTEFSTERFPILAHELQSANVDLKVLSKRAQLGPRSGFRLKTGEFFPTAKGVQHVRLVQTYASYEVYGPTAIAELDLDGCFTGQMYGDVARNLHKDIPNPEACERDVRTLLNIAIRLEKLDPRDPNIDNEDGRKVIYAHPKRRTARIVYIVEFFYTGDNFVSFPVYHIDACSNSVILSYNNIRNVSISKHQVRRNKEFPNIEPLKFYREPQVSKVDSVCSPSAAGMGGNKKMGRRHYNYPPLCLPVKKTGSTCSMEGTYAKVVNNENTEDQNRQTVITFKCSDGFSDPINGAFGVANDALYFGEKSGEFFQANYGIRALSHVPRMVVHYGNKLENAFWNGKDMFFGDGKDNLYPLVGLDVIAHELAHGLTSTNSKLIYFGRSGGIDESFSDITAVTTRFYVTNQLVWSIGEDIEKGPKAMRYLDNPHKDGRSIDNVWKYRPFMDVHYSSGVFNYAFYKMVNTHKMDIYKAYECFLKANLKLWGYFTWFSKGACNVMQACYDAGYDYKDARSAFRSTGLFLIFCRHNALKTTVFPGETRRNVLVSTNRSPILEVDMTKWRGSGVRATAENRSVVRVLAATDGDVTNVIAKGNNYVKFPGNHTRVYIKLMSRHQSDVKVTLQVDQMV